MNDLEAFVERIRGLCKERGISIHKLEVELGLGNGTIVKTKNIKGEKLMKLANYFNVSPEYILGTEKADKEATLQAAFDNRPEMRMLFSVAENATKEDIEKAIKIIEALKG